MLSPNMFSPSWCLHSAESGDVLAALSTSGNSPNVCRAAEVARARSLPVLALTGATGGKLKELSGCLYLRASHADTARSGISSSHLPLPLADAGRNFYCALAMRHMIGTYHYEKCKIAKPIIL
jgi:D-sedoheptulose 7-phosphate isomerase